MRVSLASSAITSLPIIVAICRPSVFKILPFTHGVVAILSAALSYMLGFAMWATFLDGDFFSNAATGELNTGATCGLKGVTAGGEDMDFKAGAGFVLCVLAFILSIFQTILYVLANRAVAAASA